MALTVGVLFSHATGCGSEFEADADTNPPGGESAAGGGGGWNFVYRTSGGPGYTGGGQQGVIGGGVAAAMGGGTSGYSPLPVVDNDFSLSGDTTGSGNDISFDCSEGASGEDIVYAFTSSSPTRVSVQASFTGTTGGLRIIRYDNGWGSTVLPCVKPAKLEPSLAAVLPSGSWGIVVKTVDNGSGPFTLAGTIEPTSASPQGGGGGTGTWPPSGGGNGSTGGGSGTGGGSATQPGTIGPRESTRLTPGRLIRFSGSANSERYFYVDVPPGTTTLEINASVGIGDPDLYERAGVAPVRRSSTFDHAATDPGFDKIIINAPAEGRHYILVYGYEDYARTALSITYH